MRESVAEEAACVLDVMSNMIDALPPAWQIEQVCLSAAHILAHLVATHYGKVDDLAIVELMAVGSAMIAVARTAEEASDALSRLGGEEQADG